MGFSPTDTHAAPTPQGDDGYPEVPGIDVVDGELIPRETRLPAQRTVGAAE